eukprot:5036652-Pyramimonas_sp.AAC.1
MWCRGTVSPRGMQTFRPARRLTTTAKSGFLLIGISSWRTNQTQEARVYSHDGPIGHRKRGYILMTDQSDTGSA